MNLLPLRGDEPKRGEKKILQHTTHKLSTMVREMGKSIEWWGDRDEDERVNLRRMENKVEK